jgi:uncharacterized protein
LKFNIRDIPPEGLHVRRTLGDARVREICVPSGLALGPGPANLELDLELRMTEAPASVILLRGSMHATFEVVCSRCLGPAPIEAREEELRLTFFPEAPRVAEEELSPDDLDTYSYDGEEIDVEPVLREFLILAIPMAPVCREDCKGICGGCGADLNREPCRCAAAGEDVESTPLGEALRRLKKTS